jgi:hypothetical protein
MNFIQSTLQALEVGKGQVLARIIPLTAAVCIVGATYDMLVYKGLNDAQSMDNAQIARQLYRHKGFSTEILRPQAVMQIHDLTASKSADGKPMELFPSRFFGPEVPRVIPDTYNAPGYPCLLAGWFMFTRPEFVQTSTGISGGQMYSADRLIPFLNQTLMILTGLLVFGLGRRLFDKRVAWMSMVAFLGTDLVWQYSITALSTTLLMFLITCALMCALEVCCVGEACYQNDDRSFAPAWVWGFLVAFLLAAACLTRLHLLILLVPLFVYLIAMPRGSLLLYAVISLIVLGAVAPWLVRENMVSGNPLGSNFPLFLYGVGDYSGNQIYCAASIPSYDPLFKDVGKKEVTGLLWHIKHAWTMLGTSPLIIIFGASVMHPFKRRRTRMFHWLLFGSAVALIAANNVGSATPADVEQWNVLILLFPCMLVFGSAYFFILLDRLNLQVRLLANIIIFAIMIFGVIPLIITLTNTTYLPYNYPPYWPPAIKQFAQLSGQDEWITTDMPWATAWYGDRPSLWLPDSLAEFQNLQENVCPTGLLLLSPVSTSQPMDNFMTGEYKDWLPFVTGQTLPASFTLTSHIAIPILSGSYMLWSDRPRWGD